MATPRILVVDDDPVIAYTLARVLEARGYAAAEAHSISEAIALLRESQFDLALIDYKLADGSSGLTLASFIDKHYPDMGIVMISGDPDVDLTLGGFSVADDFVLKGSGNEQLYEAIEKVLTVSLCTDTRRQRARRNVDIPQDDAARSHDGSRPETATEAIVIGDAEFHLATRRLSRGGLQVKLTLTEGHILSTLASRFGRVVMYDELGRCLEGDDRAKRPPKERLAGFIRSLRQKIEPDPDIPQFLQTVKKRGYMLSGFTK